MSDERTNANAGEPPFDSHVKRSGVLARWWPILTVLLTLEVLVATGLLGFFLGHHGKNNNGHVTVSATGTMTATPDTVGFQVGFQTKAPSATAALNANNRKITIIERSLYARGVKKSDIQTTGLNLNRSYDTSGQPQGFQVDDTLSVTVHGIKVAGLAIGAVVKAGGNGVSINGVNFTVANTKALKSRARAEAMRHAFQKASDLAKGGHATLGAIVSVTEDENQYYPIYSGFAGLSDFVLAPGKSAVPLQPGNASVTVNVTVVYSLAH